MAEGGGLDHDDGVMAFCVDAYMGYVRGLALSIEDIEDEVSQHEQSLSLMGVDYSRGGSAGAKADKLPDGVAKLLELRERLSAEHARCANDLAYARALCRGSEDMRAVWLHKVERASYAEVGRILGCSAMTARRRVAAGERMVYATMPEEWRRYAIPNAMPQ